MKLSIREVDIEIDGQLIKFGIYNNNLEYEIDSTDLRNISISACIKALRKHSRTCATNQRQRIDLVVRLVDGEKTFWEQAVFGIFITDKGSHYNLQFAANASVGVLEDKEVYSKLLSRCSSRSVTCGDAPRAAQPQRVLNNPQGTEHRLLVHTGY